MLLSVPVAGAAPGAETPGVSTLGCGRAHPHRRDAAPRDIGGGQTVCDSSTLAAVREHYEELPYPARDPEDERRRLVQDSLSQLALIDHLFWGGRRRLDAGFRVLNAGCGTGDSAICLAEQLRGSGARIVALDLSESSLTVAAKRARVRGLDGIEFVRGSIEELPSMGLGRFDYVVASGVLHHLASPERGLVSLCDVLAPDGGLGVMVYGRYGRTGVYHMQELLRILAPANQPTAARLRTVRHLLGRLRPEHPARLYADSWERELRENGGPAGETALLDLFLHPQDRSYTIPELYEWLAGAGLRLAGFDMPGAYDPRTYAPELDVERLALPKRHALAELLHGRMGHHRFFAQPEAAPTPPVPAPDDESAVPAWSRYDPEGERDRILAEGGPFTVSFGDLTSEVSLTPLGIEILRRVDGQRSLGEILDAVGAASGPVPRRRARQEWERLYAELRGGSELVLNASPPAGDR